MGHNCAWLFQETCNTCPLLGQCCKEWRNEKA